MRERGRRGSAGGCAPTRAFAAGSLVGLALTLAGASGGCSSRAPTAAACGSPAEGCPCELPGVVIGCSETLDYVPGADVAHCRTGLRACTGGAWGACVGEARAFQSVPAALTKSTTPSPCVGNPCDPTCQNFVDDARDVDAGGAVTTADGGGLAIAPQDASMVLSDGAVPGCQGLQCQIAACGGDWRATKLQGRVYDPAGKNPIPNVLVYVPNAALSALGEGASCAACTTGSGSPIVSALTDATGHFVLEGVPSGAGVTLVVQSGKWRRQIALPSIASCVTTNLDGQTGADGRALIRFPKNRGEGNIPRIAFVSGSADPFECVLLKMGLDADGTGEFAGPVDASGALRAQRVHWYNSTKSAGYDLSATAGGPGASAGDLLGSASRLADYDAVILACEGGEYTSRGTQYANLVDYANGGGRVFMTHFSYVWLQYAAAASQWPSVVTGWTDHSIGWSMDDSSLSAYVDRSFTKGDQLAMWLQYVGASTTPGVLSLNEWRRDYTLVDATRARRWMRAYSNDPAGPAASSGSCASASDCKGWESCVGVGAAGHCADGSSCWYDSQCGRHYCSSGGDCASGFSCTAPWWWSSYRCTPDQRCLGASPGTCQARTCSTDADCGAGLDCMAGHCAPQHDDEPLMTFDTPVGTPAASQCGRVVFSDFHVSANALSSGWTFPSSCRTGDLSSQEKALEYMLFDLTSCLSPDWVPPGAPPYRYPVSVVREYQASCPVGYRPIWHFFDWKTHTPSDSRITFEAQTGDTPAEVAAMTKVPLGGASGAPVTVWTGTDVATAIAPTKSGLLLDVTITLTPSTDGLQTPVLDAFRQAYDCVAVE
jgi:hypothetical protein